SGAIRDTAIDYVDVALITAAELAKRYPEALRSRYKLTTLPAYDAHPDADKVDADGDERPDLMAQAGFDGHAILADIAAKRGGLRAGGEIDLHRGAEVLLHELRDGKLGRLTLETPDDIPVDAPADDDISAEASPSAADDSSASGGATSED
ncbi:MAG: ribosome biogenesis GTPase YlqF, partial [Pseudomonadota bacterium]|nr:ribosome biogenesis GTPase YlqF [Pseudomonadota bacterium]